MLIGLFILDYMLGPSPNCKSQLAFDRCPVLLRESDTCRQRSTLQPIIDRAEGYFVCCTSIVAQLRLCGSSALLTPDAREALGRGDVLRTAAEWESLWERSGGGVSWRHRNRKWAAAAAAPVPETTSSPRPLPVLVHRQTSAYAASANIYTNSNVSFARVTRVT